MYFRYTLRQESHHIQSPYPFSKDKFLDNSKLKEFADDNSKFDENGGKFFKRVGNTVGKGKKCSL